MAKKDVAGIVAGAGLLTGIWTEFAQAVRERGGTDEDIHRLATPEGRAIIAQWADLTVRKPAGDSYIFDINRTKSLAELIGLAHYDGYVNPNIIENNFSVESGPAALEGVLLHPNRVITSETVLREGDEQGLRPATMAEGQSFAAKYPDLQRKFPILLLGSVWTDPGGLCCVGCLLGNAGRRKLNLKRFDNDWNPNYRFLFVRKSLYVSVGSAGSYSCFRHPPSIFPTSLRGSLSRRYFLLSRAFNSQATLRKNLRASSLVLARWTSTSFWGFAA